MALHGSGFNRASADSWSTARGIAVTNAKNPRAFSTRLGASGGVASTPKFTTSTSTGTTYRNRVIIPISGQVADVQFAFPNWGLNSTGEYPGDNAITVKAALEYGGVSYPLFFGGQTSVTIQPGAEALSDPFGGELVGGSAVYLRIFISVASIGQTWPLGRLQAPLLAEARTDGSDLTASTGALATGGSYLYGPSYAMGIYLPDRANALIVGDSISAGSGEVSANGDGSGNLGFIERAFGTAFPWITSTRSGTRLSDFNTAHTRRMVRVRGLCKYILCELGVNDINAGSSLATVQAAALAAWTSMGVAGFSQVWQTTITPYTTSTDGWATTGNQTLVSAPANTVRTSYNDWLRGGAPISAGVAVAVGTPGALLAGQSGHPLAGVVEVADLAESARNSGLWAIPAGVRTIADAATTAASTTVTSATANFTNADIGAGFSIAGAGAAGARYNGAIVSVTNSTTVVVSSAPATTVSGASATIGGLTADGLHPTTLGHVRLSPALTSFVALVTAG